MEREIQHIALNAVWRSAPAPPTFEDTPIGQVFAFDANALAAEAQVSQLTSHQLLLRLTVKGLWEARPKRTVLAGYLPGRAEQPVCRLYLMSVRNFAWT